MLNFRFRVIPQSWPNLEATGRIDLEQHTLLSSGASHGRFVVPEVYQKTPKWKGRIL